MELLITPADRFDNLPGWAWEPTMHDVGEDVRMAVYADGPADGPVVLLLHGEPTWSYLYRHMIPPLVAAGHRVVAPDLIGFGQSDKPADKTAHTYNNHVAWMNTLVCDALDLTDVTLFCQDWGSLIGLRTVGEHPDRFARVVLGNGGMPTGDQQMPEAFLKWQEFSQSTPEFPVGKFVQGASKSVLSDGEIAAYDAPFPEESWKVAPRMMPTLVPTSPDDPANAANKAAWESLMSFTKPFLTTFSDGDPITAGGDKVFHKLVPGTQGQPHTTVSGGHFLQEDAGPELAQLIIDFMDVT